MSRDIDELFAKTNTEEVKVKSEVKPTVVEKKESFPFSTEAEIKAKRAIKPIDLNTDFEASGKRLLELKAGRDSGDIPMGDEYWKAIKKHNLAFGMK